MSSKETLWEFLLNAPRIPRGQGRAAAAKAERSRGHQRPGLGAGAERGEL